MRNVERRILSLVAPLAAAALLATAGGLSAQGEAQERSGGEEKSGAAAQERDRSQAESRPAGPARRPMPQVTGTVTHWRKGRLELKTADGKTQKVAVNPETERLVEIAPGAEVTVEYRRKISGFVIAERVLPAQAEAAPASPAAAPGQEPASLTGKVVSWNDAALVLGTEAGEVTLFLAPETEYLVKSLDPGLQVVVEYQETAGGGKLATRVRPAGEKAAAKKEGKP